MERERGEDAVGAEVAAVEEREPLAVLGDGERASIEIGGDADGVLGSPLHRVLCLLSIVDGNQLGYEGRTPAVLITAGEALRFLIVASKLGRRPSDGRITLHVIEYDLVPHPTR